MSELVYYQLTDGIARIELRNGKANAISCEVIDQLNHCLNRAEQAQAVVVITGSASIFSAGYDLKILSKGKNEAKELVKKGSLLAKRLLSFPLPVIAACNGHAIAKGAFLLLSVDYRLGVSGPYKIGLNEVKIGITLHHAGLTIAEYRLSPNYFQRSVICAEVFNPEDAVKAGFLDKVVSEDKLADEAWDLALDMKELDKNAHRKTKIKARSAIIDRLTMAIEKDDVNLF